MLEVERLSKLSGVRVHFPDNEVTQVSLNGMAFDDEIPHFLTSPSIIAFNRQQGAREQAFIARLSPRSLVGTFAVPVPVEECQVPPKTKLLY